MKKDWYKKYLSEKKKRFENRNRLLNLLNNFINDVALMQDNDWAERISKFWYEKMYKLTQMTEQDFKDLDSRK